MRSELLRDVAYACELESQDTKSSIDYGGGSQSISLYTALTENICHVNKWSILLCT